MLQTEHTGTGNNCRAFDCIAKFTSISGPLMRVEDIQDLGIYTCHQSSILPIESPNHNLREQRDVFRTRTERWKEDLEYTQSVEDVIPHLGPRRLAGCRQESDINGDLGTTAEAPDAQRFENTEQFWVALIEAFRRVRPERAFRREPARNTRHDTLSPQ
jgi:hypothetical protein